MSMRPIRNESRCKNRSGVCTKLIIMAVVFLFISPSCIGSNDFNAGNPTSTSSATASSAINSSPTIYTPSTILPTASDTNQACSKTQNLNADQSKVGGTFVYYGATSKQSSAVSIDSPVTIVLKHVTTTRFAISNDHSTIASFDSSTDSIRVFSQDEERAFSLPENTYLDGFLADGRIRLGISITILLKQGYNEGVGLNDEYYILSPISGELEPQSVFLPYYWHDSASSYRKYSPDTRYVLYSAKYNNMLTNILLDTRNQKIIWSGGENNFGYTGFPFPAWSSDSSTIMIIQSETGGFDQQNFYSISTDGQYSQLTRLEQSINASYRLIAWEWSPNNRYIAFLAKLSPSTAMDKGNLLLVLDRQTGSVINPCVSIMSDNLDNLPRVMFWSPDGNTLAVVISGSAYEVTVDPNQPDNNMLNIVPGNLPRVIIVELVNKVLNELPNIFGSEPMQLLGWVNWATQ